MRIEDNVSERVGWRFIGTGRQEEEDAGHLF